MSSDLSYRGPDNGPGGWDDPWKRWEATAHEPEIKSLSKAAVTSLVFGLIGGVLFAYIFGFIGLGATGKNGSRRGRGFAVAGVILATVWIAAIVGVVVWHQSQQADRNANGSVTNAGNSDIFDLRPGDCLLHAGRDGGTFTQAAVVPCNQAHRSQVVTEVPLTDAGIYDSAAIQAEAEKLCTTETPKVVTQDVPADAQLFYLVPDADAWNVRDKRTAMCVISSATDLTKSYVTSG